MDTIYNNFWFNLLLTIAYAGFALNFGVAAVMLISDPIVIESDAVGSNLSVGNLIITQDLQDYESMRYSYQVYMQKAVLTPMLYNFVNTFEYFIYVDTTITSLNKEAEKSKAEKTYFEVLSLNTLRKVVVNPVE